MRRVLALAVLIAVALLARGRVWASEGKNSDPQTAALMRSMLLGAGVLIAAFVIIVETAVTWYARSRREVESQGRREASFSQRSPV